MFVDGSALEPNYTVSDHQYIFDPLWCRSVEYDNERKESLSNMTVHRYIQSLDVYNNSLYSRGFCSGGKCLPAGVMDATACQGFTSRSLSELVIQSVTTFMYHQKL